MTKTVIKKQIPRKGIFSTFGGFHLHLSIFNISRRAKQLFAVAILPYWCLSCWLPETYLRSISLAVCCLGTEPHTQPIFPGSTLPPPPHPSSRTGEYWPPVVFVVRSSVRTAKCPSRSVSKRLIWNFRLVNYPYIRR